MANQTSESRFIGISELAALLSVTPQTIKNLEAQGDFPQSIRLSARKRLWERDAVERHLRSLASNQRHAATCNPLIGRAGIH